MTLLRTRARATPASDDDHDVDPRIADRRHEVTRGRRSRLRRRLAAIALVLVVVIGAVGLTRGPLLDVDRIEVTGADRTGADAVVAASGIVVGVPLTDLDLGAVASAAGELPWILDVAVNRSWFGTVEIAVEERRAVASIELADGSWYLIGEEGRLLEAVDEPDPGLLQLVGAPDAAGDSGDEVPGAADHLAVVAAMTGPVAERVFAVASVDGQLELWMAPAGLVVLGPATRLDEKFLALDTVFAQVDDRCLAVLDVRVPTSPTMNRIPACANPAPDPPPVAVDGTGGDATGGDATGRVGDEGGDVHEGGGVEIEVTP